VTRTGFGAGRLVSCLTGWLLSPSSSQYERRFGDRSEFSLACVLDGHCGVNFKDQVPTPPKKRRIRSQAFDRIRGPTWSFSKGSLEPLSAVPPHISSPELPDRPLGILEECSRLNLVTEEPIAFG
jgi:hypothetical protein